VTSRADVKVEHLLRELAPQVLGAVARRNSDFAFADDAVQEALIAAAKQWPAEGIPSNPLGWLYQVAIRRLSDQVRSEVARKRREDAVATMYFADEAAQKPIDVEPEIEGDEVLVLLFMCCHSALTPASAIALTLRAVGGLTTAEIANAFLVPESTMAQRISRAKQAIKTSKVPFSMPVGADLVARLGSVLHVLYLIFNEGYSSTDGASLQRLDLSSEAIRLTRALWELIPDHPEIEGLLALMLLTDARRLARSGPNGELIPLDEQDRSLWNRDQIAEGVALVSASLRRGPPGPYAIQAAIAAIHDESPSVAETDWSEILLFYDLLVDMSESPMIRLNRAIAVAMVRGPSAGLEVLDALRDDARVSDHHRMHAVRAHLHEMLGDSDKARANFHLAAVKTSSVAERDYLNLKIARLSAGARR
jgi:RNA polymerase sigma factor (sigma-70 family)